jgi:replication factor C subunit 3/5
MIHLNASDERGIDIIRSQINNFVNSKTMFNQGMKFVILDEVDYMTKTAQIALKYLIEYYSNYNVRYCLICNYITKIDSNLQTYFCKLKFNCIPLTYIFNFLNSLCINEKLTLSNDYLNYIIYLYNNDIRSMINHLQLHHINNVIYNNTIYEQLYTININCDYKTYKQFFNIVNLYKYHRVIYLI